MMTQPRMMDTSAPAPTVTDSSFCMEYCMECGPPFLETKGIPQRPVGWGTRWACSRKQGINIIFTNDYIRFRAMLNVASTHLSHGKNSA